MKHPHLYSFLITALILVFILIMATLTVIASTSTYYLDVSRLEIHVSPTSNTASGVVKVSSNSDHPIRLKVIPKLWTLNPQGLITYIDPPATGFNLLENIGINPEEFVLLPKKSRLVRFIVKLPPDVANAEYPFQLYFQPTDILEPTAKAQNAGINNVLDVVPVFTTTVYAYQGNPTPSVKIDHFQCGYLSQKSQLPVELTVENSGNKHARLFGNIILNQKNASGAYQPVDVLHMLNSTLLIVFPGMTRTVQENLVSQALKKLPAGGNYRLELQLVDERNIQPAVKTTCDFST